MAVAVQAVATEIDQVLTAVGDRCAALMEVANEMPLAEFVAAPRAAGALRSVVVPGLRSVEIALDEEFDPALLTSVAWDLLAKGWTLTVLVTLDRLGEAHGALRGTPCVLQGWWDDGVDVHFTGPERP